jgi:hypothetical protein
MESLPGACQAESGLLIPALVQLYDVNGDGQDDRMEIWRSGKRVAVIQLGLNGALSSAEVLENGRLHRYDNPAQFTPLYPDVCTVVLGRKTGA